MFRLEKIEEAIEDANTAMEINKDNTKAIVAKAEALFSSGNFEQALVHFERGNKILNSEEMQFGLMKARQAILNVIGDGLVEFDSRKVEGVIENKKRMKVINKKVKTQTLVTRKVYSGKRLPPLNISNVLEEEELFLKRLRDIEKFHVRISVRRGTRRTQCQVSLVC